MSFHTTFHTVGENDGNRNQWSGIIQNTACMIYIDCMHPKTALRSSSSWSGVSHRCHLLTLPFLCPYFRAGSNASAATLHLCLMCTGNRKVSTRGREDALAAHVGVISGYNYIGTVESFYFFPNWKLRFLYPSSLGFLFFFFWAHCLGF